MAKLRVRLGDLEVEAEGDEEFLTSEIPKLMKVVGDMSPVSLNSPDGGRSGRVQEASKIQMTTANIASRLDASSGAELVVAAAAHFALVKNQDSISRKALLAEMKTAAGYYKSSYGSNLSNYLSTLIKEGRLIEPSAGIYALAAAELKRVRDQLAS